LRVVAVVVDGELRLDSVSAGRNVDGIRQVRGSERVRARRLDERDAGGGVAELHVLHHVFVERLRRRMLRERERRVHEVGEVRRAARDLREPRLALHAVDALPAVVVLVEEERMHVVGRLPLRKAHRFIRQRDLDRRPESEAVRAEAVSTARRRHVLHPAIHGGELRLRERPDRDAHGLLDGSSGDPNRRAAVRECFRCMRRHQLAIRSTHVFYELPGYARRRGRRHRGCAFATFHRDRANDGRPIGVGRRELERPCRSFRARSRDQTFERAVATDVGAERLPIDANARRTRSVGGRFDEPADVRAVGAAFAMERKAQNELGLRLRDTRRNGHEGETKMRDPVTRLIGTRRG